MKTSDPPEPDDFELGDLENESFIPNDGVTSRSLYRSRSFLTAWMPPRVQRLIDNLSRVKVMIIGLVLFVAGLVFLGWVGKEKPIVVPKESKLLSEDVMKALMGTAIPQYAIRNAPLVFLDRKEAYFPSDLATHIENTHPTINFSAVDTEALNLGNLDLLNDRGGEDIYLSSKEKATSLPKYLEGQKPGKKTLKTENAISASIIVVERGYGIVDVFYLYFYSFNKGPVVLDHEIGNHVGDWYVEDREHNMVRFIDGVPTHLWYSQHEYGEPFSFSRLKKLGGVENGRPIVYSARGSHANYAFVGEHDLHDGSPDIPKNYVFDYASRGLLWDPTLSAYFHTYSIDHKNFTSVPESTPKGYLYFEGQWGDQKFKDEDPEQSTFYGLQKWNGGPQGPIYKGLDRGQVCLPSERKCATRSYSS